MSEQSKIDLIAELCIELDLGVVVDNQEAVEVFPGHPRYEQAEKLFKDGVYRRWERVTTFTFLLRV